jgi:hypothetical protein
VCKYYDSLDSFELDVEAYEENLKMRVKAYQKILDELEVDSFDQAIKEVEKKIAGQPREAGFE